MIIIIFQTLFILSVLGILYLVFRRIPDILELPRHSGEETRIYETLQKQWKILKEKAEASEFLHEILIPKTEKILRRTKIVVLKFDNFLAKKADKLRERMRKTKRENKKKNNLPE